MFISITSESFFKSVIPPLGEYYCVGSLILYYRRFTTFFKTKEAPTKAQVQPQGTDKPESNYLIGSITHEESCLNQRLSLTSTGGIEFAEVEIYTK